MQTEDFNYPIKFVAIGALGNMLAPAARHLQNKNVALCLRVLDRDRPGVQRDQRRQAWKDHGAVLVPTIAELVSDGEFTLIVICAGKNGDDFQIFRSLISLLQPFLAHRRYFILHLSTVSCDFVLATQAFCQRHGVQYVNYPLTGGVKGAEAGKMLILASGDKNIYSYLEPMLSFLGVPQYFGEKIELAAATKLIGQVLVYHGLLGLSLAVGIQRQAFSAEKGSHSVDFFDFLNNGAGGTKQWEFAVRKGLSEDNWSEGFLIRHAVVDAIYTIDLMLKKQLPGMLILPLLELTLLFVFILLNDSQEIDFTTQRVTYWIAEKPKELIDAFLNQHLSLNLEATLKNCITMLPKAIQKTVMISPDYSVNLVVCSEIV